MKNLRLYVVGESSGNPETWGEYKGYSIVAARSPEEALTFSNWNEVAEIVIDRPMIVCTVLGGGDGLG